MKVIIGMILTAVLTATAVQAQHVNMGIKGGLNLYSIYNADNSGTELKPGWHRFTLAYS
jgi:hypothetical protein